MKLAMPLEPEMLRSTVKSDSIGVDREGSVINGYVVAELGPFKTPGRGEFTQDSLEKIVELGNAKASGLKSRFQHPSASDDGLGKHIGRAKNFRLDGSKVRADLHISPTALQPPPNGGGTPLGEYVMHLAETDPGAFSTSLVLKPDRQYRLNEDGTRKRDKDGNPLPPIWMPEDLMASDVVDTGDAVNDFLSAEQLESLPNSGVFQVAEAIGKTFKGQDRKVVKARCEAFLNRYLDQHFGPEKEELMSDTPQKSDDINVTERLEAKLEQALGVIDEMKNQLMERDKADSERRAKELRERKVREKCKMLGSGKFEYDGKNLSSAEVAEAILEDESLSDSEISDRLFKLMARTREANKDGGHDHDDQDLDSKYRQEYLQGIRWHKQLGVSEEEYIKRRRVEDGKEAGSPKVLSSEWALSMEQKLKKEIGLA